MFTVSDDATTVRVKTTRGAAIKAAIPAAVEYLDAVDVPWTHTNAEALSGLGVTAISPIVRDFTFAGPWPAMPHQMQVASFMTLNPRAFVLAEMGTGKTAAAIWALMYLRSLGLVRRVLVIAPLSVVDAAWGTDIFRIDTKMRYAILHGTADKRRKLLAQGQFWNIINPDGVGTIKKELAGAGFDAVIIDESRAYADDSTARWKALETITRGARYVWGLTGTPTPKSPMDSFGQAKLITRTVAGAMYHFRSRVMYSPREHIWEPRADAWDTVRAVLTPAIRIRKEDVLKNMPPVTYSHRYVELTALQKRAFDEMRKEGVADEQMGQRVSAVNAGVRRIKLLQIASGAVYADDGAALQFNVDASARVAEVIRIVEECSAGVLLFAPFRHTVSMLSAALKDYNFAEINGDVSPTRRQEIFQAFARGEYKGIVAVPSTMSHGITATAASTTVWFAPIDSAEVYLQANARMDRPGQKNHMHIIHLYGTPFEQKVYAALADQKSSQQALLDTYQQFIRGD